MGKPGSRVMCLFAALCLFCDGDATTSQVRSAGGTAVEKNSVTLSEQSDKKPYVGRSGSTGDASKEECSSKEGNSTPSGAGYPFNLIPQSSQEPTHPPIEAIIQDKGKMTLDQIDLKVGSSKATGTSATTTEDRLVELELKWANELKDVRKELHDHKQAAQESLARQQREIDSLKSVVQTLIQEREDLKQRLEEVLEELDKQKREKGELKEENEKLKEENVKLKSEKEEVQSKLAEKESQLAEKERQLAEKEKELKRKDRKLQEAQALQAQTQMELEDSKRACSDLQTDALKALLEDKSSPIYKCHEAMRNINRTFQEALGDRQQDGQDPQEPPPPYDDSMQGAPSSVEASQPDGPDLAISVQGPVSHDQPPVGIHTLGLREQRQNDDDSNDEDNP